MSEIDLKRLRHLRRKAEELAGTLVSDLEPFRHPEESNGFCRRPDSPTDANDINVTTTCSCLMALALSDKLGDLYKRDSKQLAIKIFTKLVNAPWMSSGLTENNAFTATLVFRLYGLLQEAGAAPDINLIGTKYWESSLQFKDFKVFATKLINKSGDVFSKYLFDLFPEELQKLIEAFVVTEKDIDKTIKKASVEIERLIRNANFNDNTLLSGVKVSPQTESLRKIKPNGYVVAQLNRLLLHDVYSSELKPINTISLKDIALEMSSDMDKFKINDYPPSSAVLYWFVDGIDRAKIDLLEDDWKKLYKLAAEEFRQQRSLVVAKHDAMMDPVSMAMSACLCSRLRSISNEPKSKIGKNLLTYLPSSIELESSIVDLFLRQTESGIWPKFFPLFHYQDAGSNFCFTFELLEAVLFEFGGDQNTLLTEEAVILGLERAINWCEKNRLHYPQEKSGKNIIFKGWNSGGNLETLKRGQPESWATAVVHMFLWELVEVLSKHIQKRLLERYEAKRPGGKWKTTQELLDIDLKLDGGSSLKETLKDTIIDTFSDFNDKKSGKLRKKPIKKKPLSALLFGPPGTSKTEVAKAFAKELKWPLVEIDPSHFLLNSFQNIYVQAEKIFEDVMDMTGVVLLFDEMDALVQKRDGDATLDTESKFLTTYMLPKLAKLHDRGRLIFLMATNFQAAFDDAIKRAGRFDLLLCMGPPTLKSKCEGIHIFYELDSSTDETREAGEIITQFCKDQWLADQLELYTYGEFLSFITGLEGDPKNLAETLKGMGEKKFTENVKDDSRSALLKIDDLFVEFKKYEKLKNCRTFKECDQQDFDESELKVAKIDVKLPVIKYLLDRKQTKRQYPKLAKPPKTIGVFA